LTDQDWFARFSGELRARAVPEATIQLVVDEAFGYVRDSRQPADQAFGIPEAHAARLAGSLVPATGQSRSAARQPDAQVRLSAQGIGKRYGRRWVFQDLDLTVRAGQIAAVIGANGAGKTTFLGICAGFVSPSEGRVSVTGSTGYCPQHGGTLDYLRPDEHFALIGAGRGLKPREAAAQGRELAAALQWNVTGAKQARQLSGGTRQKLNLVLACLGNPDLLLLDEPYQGFDQGTYLDFWQRLWQLRDQGKAIVVVTHLLENLDRVDLVLDLMARRAQGAGV